MNHYKELYPVMSAHPEKQQIITRLSVHCQLSERSIYRLVINKTIIGREGVIALLFNEFAIKLDSQTGYSIDYFKLAEIKTAPARGVNLHGLT